MNQDGYGPEVYDVALVMKWRKEWGYLFEGTTAEGGGYTLVDNGNNIHIQGHNMDITLDYMTTEAVFRLLSLADKHTTKYHYNSMGWTTAPVIETRLVRKAKESK
jgi:hypothetical protein